jgi:hypothetical protein
VKTGARGSRRRRRGPPRRAGRERVAQFRRRQELFKREPHREPQRSADKAERPSFAHVCDSGACVEFGCANWRKSRHATAWGTSTTESSVATRTLRTRSRSTKCGGWIARPRTLGTRVRKRSGAVAGQTLPSVVRTWSGGHTWTNHKPSGSKSLSPLRLFRAEGMGLEPTTGFPAPEFQSGRWPFAYPPETTLARRMAP